MNSSAGLTAVVPLGVMTVTSTLPADPPGERAVTDVGPLTV